MDNANVRWRVSLWGAATPSGPDLPRLVGPAEADVIVVGGGFTGLSTALHLREAGVDVTIIEAMETGWGASGRNNGQVIPALSRPDPDDIVTKHGAAGERFVALLRDSASTLFDIARCYQIQAEQEQTGWVQPAHSLGRIKIAERRVGRNSARRSNCSRATRRARCSGQTPGSALRACAIARRTRTSVSSLRRKLNSMVLVRALPSLPLVETMKRLSLPSRVMSEIVRPENGL